MKKGSRRPVEMFTLVVGETITDEHIAAVDLAMRFRQTVTAKIGAHTPEYKIADQTPPDEKCIVLEARPS